MKKILAFLALVGLVAAAPASADNYKPNPSAGATVASDTIGGIEFPRVKMTFGPPKSSTDVSIANPLPTARQDTVLVPFTSGAAVNAVLFSTDTAGFGSVVFQVTGTFVATISFQASDDSVNWYTVNAQNSGTTGFATTINGVGLFVLPTQHRYARAIVTAYTSGTINGTAYLRYSSLDPSSSTVLAASGSQIGGVVISASIVSPGAPAYSQFLFNAAATTNASSLKASAARLIGGSIYNVSTTVKFFKFYNKASAPVVGTDVPTLVIIVPPGANIPIPTVATAMGMYFNTGLAFSVTGGISSADTTAVGAAGDVVATLLYL